MDPPELRTRAAGLARLRRGVRRRVLVHRRLLAAVLVGVAVLCALRVLQPRPPLTHPVWVAAKDLTSGQRLTRADVARRGLPAEDVPDGVLAVDGLVGARIAGPMRRGEVLTDRRVLGPSLLDERPGLVAVPVRPADPAVATLLRAGDRIDVVRVDPDSDRGGERLATDVEVLAVPHATTSDSADGLSPLGGTGRTGSANGEGLVVLAIEDDLATDVAATSLEGFLVVTLAR